MMAKRPEQRYETPVDVANALAACLGPLPVVPQADIPARAPAGPVDPGGLAVRRRRRRWWLLVPVAAALLVTLLALNGTFRPPVSPPAGPAVPPGSNADRQTDPGIWTPLARSGWRASASDNPAEAGKALQDDPDGGWRSGVAQKEGMWFQIDLGQPLTFARLLLDARRQAGYQAPGYKVLVSDTGSNWEKAATIVHGLSVSPTIDVALVNPVTTRHVRILLTNPNKARPWAIDDVRLYARAPVVWKKLDPSRWRASASDKTDEAWKPLVNPKTEGSGDTWWGNNNSEQLESVWYQVDFGSQVSFSRIDLGGGFRDVKMQVSDTGQDWDTRPVLLMNDIDNVVGIALSMPAQGRYLRLTFIRPSQNGWRGLHWIHLYRADAVITKSP
jgi:hypothetical protein